MRSGYFVFEKDPTHQVPSGPSGPYEFAANLNTLPKLREYLNARLNDGLDAKDFLIIRGREERITGVKVVAEFETPET